MMKMMKMMNMMKMVKMMMMMTMTIMDHIYIKNTQPFRNSGAEQRQGCTVHVFTVNAWEV